MSFKEFDGNRDTPELAGFLVGCYVIAVHKSGATGVAMREVNMFHWLICSFSVNDIHLRTGLSVHLQCLRKHSYLVCSEIVPVVMISKNHKKGAINHPKKTYHF
jgi:hypothetical protein